MSNALGIATVTTALRNLLLKVKQPLPGDAPPSTPGGGEATVLADTDVSTKPLDKAFGGSTQDKNQLNIFLYHPVVNAAFSNADYPRRGPAERAGPPLALDLHYLISACGRGYDDVLAHRLLGRAMRLLHDAPLLSKEALDAAIPGNDLSRQVERVRITAKPLSLEELSKLWSSFQTVYRVSVAYQVSVVLIESTLAVQQPLPVLRRGPGGEAGLVLGALPPFPSLTTVAPANGQTAARLGVTSGVAITAGDAVTLRGRLVAGATKVAVSGPDGVSFQLAATPAGEPDALTMRLPSDPGSGSTWRAGIHRVEVIVGAGKTTNAVALPVAPRLRLGASTVTRDAGGRVTIAVTCVPFVGPTQRASLLLGDREIAAAPRSQPTGSLAFVVDHAPVGDLVVRLRVDGVDSLVFEPPSDPSAPLVVDPSQRVVIR